MIAPKLLFEGLAGETWDRLRLGWNYNVSQGEETITDLLQLEIARLGAPHIYVVKTTKAHEAQSGVDWEWWIGSNKWGWLRFAVQAKKLNKNGRYQALQHMVNHVKLGKKPQHHLLTRYALSNGAIPLYCLFNYREPLAVDPARHWHCPDHFRIEQLGCSLASLKSVKDALSTPKHRTFDFIHTYSSTIPWRCLFCGTCPGFVSLINETRNQWGFNPTLYSSLPEKLAFAQETDAVISFLDDDADSDWPKQRFSEDIPHPSRTQFWVFPRRILIIETDLRAFIEEFRFHLNLE